MDIKSIVNEIKSNNVNEVAIPVDLSIADNTAVSIDEISVPMYQCVDPSAFIETRVHVAGHHAIKQYEETGKCCCDDCC